MKKIIDIDNFEIIMFSIGAVLFLAIVINYYFELIKGL